MKILMATMGLDIGGAETHIVELAKELQAQGHEILVASAGGVYVPQIMEVGIRHFVVPMHRREVKKLFESKRLLKTIILEEKPDIVHAHARIPGFLCGLLHKKMKFPFVTTAHWVFHTGGGLRVLTDWGQRVMAVSEDIREYLIREYGYSPQHISVTINGIDTEKFAPTQTGEEIFNEFSLVSGVPTLVSVSRMDEDRGLVAKQLIDIAENLCEDIPDLQMVLVGGGNILSQLEEKVKAVNQALGRRAVVLTGPRTDINQFVAVADVFVGVSRSALEAMSSGKVVIVAGNEGYQGIFRESCLEDAIAGNFCCRGMPLSTELLLERDVKEAFGYDVSQREALGAYGREVILTYYSVGRMANDCLAMYEDLLKPRHRLVVSGYYGFDNAGDDGILQAIGQQIACKEMGIDVTVLSNNPKDTTQRYGLEAIPRFHLWKVTKALRECDGLLSGGGSLLQDRTSTRSILYYLWVISCGQRFHKPVMLYANGIGPVTKGGNRRRVKKAVERATLVTLRDSDSAEELRSMGVTRKDLYVTADPVQALAPSEAMEREKILNEVGITGEFVTISVREWGAMSQFVEELAIFCDALATKYQLEILFVCMQTPRDEGVSRRVQEKMKGESRLLSKKVPPDVLMSVLGQAKLCVAMRLHTLIFSARMGVPLLGLVYDPKVESYLKELGQPSGGDVSSFRSGEALEKVDALMEKYDEVREEIRGHSQRLEALAEGNQKLLLEMLAKG